MFLPKLPFGLPGAVAGPDEFHGGQRHQQSPVALLRPSALLGGTLLAGKSRLGNPSAASVFSAFGLIEIVQNARTDVKRNSYKTRELPAKKCSPVEGQRAVCRVKMNKLT
jgi:hypothetical protein